MAVMRKRRGNANLCGQEEGLRLMFTLHPEAWRENRASEDPPDSLRPFTDQTSTLKQS